MTTFNFAPTGDRPLVIVNGQVRQLATGGALSGAEPQLGNPAADGYVLQSTAAGVRTWTNTPTVATASQGTSTTQVASTAFVIGEMNRHRNRIRNGNFTINQRAVSGTVSLSAGQYGHDGWKGGASGCTYTFAKSANVTTLTITAGSLQQVVDGEWLFSGTHCLSWTGSAQGKIGAGSYSASGVTGSATGGTNLTIEFGTGTLSMVQLEPSATPTGFEFRDDELYRNLRYYYRIYPAATGSPFGFAWTYSATVAILFVKFPVPMRAAPTALEQSGTANQYAAYQGNVVTQCSSVPVFSNANTHFSMTNITVASGLTVGWSGIVISDLTNGAGAYLAWSAEL